MPYSILAPEETDADILGKLPDQIRRSEQIAQPLEDDPPLVHIPRPFIGVTAMAHNPVQLVGLQEAAVEYRRAPVAPPVVHKPTLRQRFQRWLKTENGRDAKMTLGGLALFVGFLVITVVGAVI